MIINRRGGFSDRNKIKPVNTEIQLTEFDNRTRIQLQNMLSQMYDEVYEHDLYYREGHIQDFLKYVLGNVYAEPVDSRNIYSDENVWDAINNSIQNDSYDDVLTLIEAIVQHWDLYLKESKGYGHYDEYGKSYTRNSIFEYVNIYFEKEFVGYRFINGIITPISDDLEVNSINEALEGKYKSVSEHLAKANKLLADREKPDYENSIKESISAVEAICIELTGISGKEASLGKLLKKLEENGIQIHPGLKSAFNSLYGYTSDANGIQDHVADYIFDDELVLLAEDGGNFGSKERPIAYRVSGKCWVNNHAHVLKPKSCLDVDYLCYSLMFYNTDGLVNGATRQKLTQATMRKMVIPGRSLSEQKEIVEQLNKIAEVRNLRQQEIQKLDDLIKARFVELFGKSEKKIPIKSLCDVSGGYSFKSGDISSDGGLKILQIGNVYLDDVNWNTTNYLSEGFDKTYSKFLLNNGDIVIALTRPIIQSLGNVKACIVKTSDLPCLLNQRVGRIVSKENMDVNLKFIYGCLMTDDFTKYVESCCIGCSQPNISTKDIENYLVPDVNYDEQMNFVKFKEQVDKSKFEVQKALGETQKLFDSLMQQYFG